MLRRFLPPLLALLLSAPAGAFPGTYDLVVSTPLLITPAFGFANIDADGTIEHHFPLGFFVGRTAVTAYGSWADLGNGMFETRTRAILAGGSGSLCDLLLVTSPCVLEFRNQESSSGSQIVGSWSLFVGPVGGAVTLVGVPVTSVGDRIEVLP